MTFYTSYLDERRGFRSEYTGAEEWNMHIFAVMVVDKCGCEGGIFNSSRDSETNALGMPNQDCELSMRASTFDKNLYPGAVRIGLCSHEFMSSSLFSCYSNGDRSRLISEVFYAISERSLVAYTFFRSRSFKDGDQRAAETFGAVPTTQVCGFKPNRENFVRLLYGTSRLRALVQGRVIHGYEARTGVCGMDGVFETKFLNKCVHFAAPNHRNIVFKMDDELVRLNATLSDICSTKQRSSESLVFLIVAERRLELGNNHIFSYSKVGFMILYSMSQVEATLVSIFGGNSKYDFLAWGIAIAHPWVTVVTFLDAKIGDKVKLILKESRIALNTATLRRQRHVWKSDIEADFQVRSLSFYHLALGEMEARENESLWKWNRDNTMHNAANNNFFEGKPWRESMCFRWN